MKVALFFLGVAIGSVVLAVTLDPLTLFVGVAYVFLCSKLADWLFL